MSELVFGTSSPRRWGLVLVVVAGNPTGPAALPRGNVAGSLIGSPAVERPDQPALLELGEPALLVQLYEPHLASIPSAASTIVTATVDRPNARAASARVYLLFSLHARSQMHGKRRFSGYRGFAAHDPNYSLPEISR